LAAPLPAAVVAKTAGASGVVRWPRGVAESEEAGADDGEGDEEAEDGGRAEGDLAVGCGVIAGDGAAVVGDGGLFLVDAWLIRAYSGRDGFCGRRGGRVGGGDGLVEEVDEFERQGEDDGGVLLDADLGEGLQVAAVGESWLGGHEGGGINQLAAALNSPSAWMILAAAFALGLRPALAMARSMFSGMSTCLTSDGDDLEAKRCGVAVDDGLDALVEAVRGGRAARRGRPSPSTERSVVWANCEVW